MYSKLSFGEVNDRFFFFLFFFYVVVFFAKILFYSGVISDHKSDNLPR